MKNKDKETNKSKAASGETGHCPACRTPSAKAGRKASLAALRKRSAEQLSKLIDRLDELSKQDIRKLVQELGTYQIELEVQNEELRRTQVALEESRHRYSDLYDFAPIGYFSVDPKGVIRSANLPGAAMLGKSRRELTGTPFILFVLKEDRDIYSKHTREMLRKGDRLSCELRLAGKDGSFFYGRLESSAVRDYNGNITEIRIAVSDITERRQVEEALTRERALLDAVMNATDVMLVYLDPEFNFILVNPAYAEGCRKRPEELIGRNHFALFPHEENEAIFRRVRDTGEPVFYKDKPFEFPDQPERGVTYWDWSLVAVKDNSGLVTGLVFSLRETTKYKEAELALTASEERFRLMAEISPDIIFHIDPAGNLTYVSPAMRSLGYIPEQVLGQPYVKFIAPDDVPKAIEAYSRLNSGEGLSLFELKVLRADGTVAEREINAAPIVRNGAVVGVQGISRDITERKRVEAELKASLERFELLAATASELLQSSEPYKAVELVCRRVMDRLGCDICCNFLAAEKVERYRLNVCAGISEEEVQHVDWLINTTAVSGSVARDGRRIVAERLAAPSEEGSGPGRSLDIKSYACHPLIGPGGRIGGTLFFGSRSRETFSEDDVSLMQAVADLIAVAMARMKGEQEIKQRSTELAEVNRELEAFSYTVSHDLRAPLRAIDGFTTAILEDYASCLEKGARDYFKKVIAASRRMGQLIDAMLNMARLTKGELREDTVNLSDMVAVAAYELGKMDPERRVECTIAKDMKVRGDFNLLRIVIENLLSNAWKFTAKTEMARVDFGTMQMQDSDAGTKIVYFVRDNGAGFDANFSDKLFSPFSRLHSEEEFPGIGIGLATVKKIIVRHGGKIWAEGAPGKGATFYFTLE